MKAAKVRYAAEPDESSIDRFPEQSNSSQLKRASMSDAKVQPVESFKNLYNELDTRKIYDSKIRFMRSTGYKHCMIIFPSYMKMFGK